MMIIESYSTPDKILRSHKASLVSKITTVSRKGIEKATEKYNKLVKAAESVRVFACNLDSVYFNISTTLTPIKGMDLTIAATMDKIHALVKKIPFGKVRPADLPKFHYWRRFYLGCYHHVRDW